MHIHFMGIGGSGVSGLATAAKSFGYTVSGCDLKESSFLKMVRGQGIDCMIGHDASHIDSVDILVRSSAVPLDNPEVAAALKKGIKVVTRGEFLAILLENKHKIGIGGSHGKTSTTWMIYSILCSAGVEASVYAGGKSGGKTSVSAGEPYVVELDESDGSIFKMKPDLLVITNLEFEHADFYKTPANMLKSFERYLLSERPESLIIGRGYDLSDKLFGMFSPLSFPTHDEIRHGNGFENRDQHNFYIKNGELFFISGEREIYVGDVAEPAHVLQNRSAALLAASVYLAKTGKTLPKTDREFWKNVPKVDRRFQNVGTWHGMTLIDDYAHHPSEVHALIEQAEHEFKNFCLVFQPHRISRFTAFYDKFREVLKNVGTLIVLSVYSAGEKCDGRASKELYEELKCGNDFVFYAENIDKAAEIIMENEKRFHASAIVSVGAGDVNTIFAKLMNGEK
jgi:UDP-N-acetylmuramate--alanine ligase